MEVRLGVFLFLITLSTGLCQQDDYRLFVTDAGGMIYSFDLNMTFFHYDPLGVQIVGIAVDPSSTADNYILVISTIEENGQKYFIRRVIEHDPGFQTPENEIIFDSTPYNAFVDRLAIDGVSKNIYFTAVGPANSKTSFIGVLTPQGHFTKIVSQLDIPRDIELHPARRMFFYTDHGTSPKIGWSYMDGSAHGVLITTELTWPNGLAIDYAGDKLYWTDVYNKDVAQAKIESYDLNTGTRKIEARPGVHLMDILVDGAYYFYLSWSSTTITKARLSDNVIVLTFHASWGARLDAMAVYSPQTRDLPGLYDCVERIGLGTCSTICLPSATGHSCKCPDGEECEGVVTCGPIGGGALSSTCNRYPDEMCDFSCYHGYSPITGGVFCSNSMWDISNPCLPYDSEGGDNYKMFIADSKGFVYSVNSEGQVVRVYDVKDHADETKLAEVKAIAVDAHATDADATLIYSVKDGIYKVPVDGSEAELILNTTTFGAFPAGLAIEPTSKNIYFTLAVPGNAGGSYVSILSPRGDHVGLVSGLITPRDIVLDISRSLMFWADSYEQFPYIGWAVMDGTSASLLITNQLTEMVSPHGLAIDTADDALYWTDASLGVIKRYSLTDTQITTVVSVPNSQLRDILIDGDLFFYSDLTENEVINTVRLSDVTDNTYFRINGAYKLVAMAMYSSNSRQLPGDTKCANREGRGDCSNVCLPGSQGQTCRCDNGKQLDSNAKTCENAQLCPATLSRGSLSDSCLKHDLEMCDFTCPSGFSPEVTQIKCEKQNWNNADPCKPDCVDLGSLGHGQIQRSNGNSHQSVATFTCNHGYVLKGSGTRKCQAGVWTNSNPVCEIIVCDVLSSPENGHLAAAGNEFMSEAKYTCNDGFDLRGAAEIICTITGHWSDSPPVCLAKECPEIDDPVGGKVEFSNHNIYRSVARFSCNEGYSLDGARSIECQANEQWSNDVPTCSRIVCPELTGFENGAIQLKDGRFYDSVATFSCNEGYLLNGGSSRRCETVGWSGTTPSCERIVCPEIIGFENGVIQLEDEHFYDSVATFICNEGYLLNGGNSKRCEAGGWSGIMPSCERIVCPALTGFTNGDIQLEDEHFYHSVATFSCNEGYLLNGGSSRRCEAGGWSGATPSCERIVCPELTAFENGDIHLDDDHFYDSLATFSCNEGYLLNGGSSRRCEAGGWSGATPSCERIVCDELSSPDNGHVDAPGQEFMTVATYICNDGFDLHGSDKIMCTSSGQWSDSPPVCLAKECPEISDPAGGQVEFSNTNMYHSVASFSCNEGYLLDGARSLECLANEQWSDDVPTCRQIVCEELSSPDNGQVDASGHEFMAVATYICNDGFDLHGSAEMMCTIYGQWSDSPPVCLAKDCGDPAIDNSQSFGSTKYGGYVTIYCNDGYIGGGRITCPESGVWESRPTCAAVDCADQQTSIDNGYIFGTTTYKGSAEVICAVGHKGGGAAICEYTGLWQQPLPTCSPVECPEIGDPADGHVEFSDNNMYRSVARFSCNKGYLLDGAGSIECQANEQWSNDVPICTQVECPEPEHPDNANVSYPDGQELYVGRRVQFDCHTGYERKGGPRRIECLPDFTWHMDSPYCTLIETTTTSTVSSTGTSSTSTTGMSSQTPTESPTGSSSQTSSETSTGTSSQTSTDSPTGTPSSTPVCPEPEHPDNADVSYPDGRELFVGRRVQFDCHAGYERKGGPRRIECLSDLTWHKNSPYCILIETTTTSMVSSTGTSSISNTDTSSQTPTESPTGSSSQTSSETSTDTSSQTSTDASTGTPSSTPVCQEPEHPDNADVSYPDGPELYVGRRVQFDCHAGYERKGGPRRIECLPDLTWHTDTPYCILIETTTASTISSTGTSSTSNTGSSSQTSSETSTGTPSSTPVCQEPEHPDNADVSYPDGRELFVGRRVQFDCHAGYERKGGPRRIECLSDLTWHKDSPYCTLIETTTTSTVSSTGTSPTSTSTEPHTGTSSQTSTDSPSGTSSQTAADSPTDTSPQTSTDSPTGTPSSSSECHALSAPEHGIMSLTDNFLLGSMASFECEAVYTLQGPMSIICKDDGSWTGDVPVCQRIVCPKPQPPDHCAVSYPDGEDLYVDRRVQFDCYAGYERKGPRRIWCQRNATWTKEPPTCYLPDTTATSSASTSTTSSQSSGTTGSGTSSSGLSTTAGPAQTASTTTPPVFTTSNLFPGSAGVSVKPVITLIVMAMFFVIYL